MRPPSGKSANYFKNCHRRLERIVLLFAGDMNTTASPVTELLRSAESGDLTSRDGGFPVVYEELRKLARMRMSQEAAGHTLQPTALVHEIWLRMFGQNRQHWENRAHFFSSAAEAMRRVLVEHARKKQCVKRGGEFERETLSESSLVLAVPPDDLLAVHEALDKFSLEDPTAVELVKLRYFAGMTMEEAAAALDLAPRTAERLWAYAKAWLHREICAAR